MATLSGGVVENLNNNHICRLSRYIFNLNIQQNSLHETPEQIGVKWKSHLNVLSLCVCDFIKYAADSAA